MSYTKTTWVNNSSPYINANNLNNIENGIETLDNSVQTINTNINTITNEVNDLLPNISYSTTEQVIGKWTNNKPLYRKVIYISALPNATSSTYSYNINNLKEFVSIRGVASNNTTFFILPSYRAEDVSGIEMYVDVTNGITIKTGMDRSGYHANIILEYTKITD